MMDADNNHDEEEEEEEETTRMMILMMMLMLLLMVILVMIMAMKKHMMMNKMMMKAMIMAAMFLFAWLCFYLIVVWQMCLVVCCKLVVCCWLLLLLLLLITLLFAQNKHNRARPCNKDNRVEGKGSGPGFVLSSLKLIVRTCQVVPSQKERIVFQPSIFRCENVSFREAIALVQVFHLSSASWNKLKYQSIEHHCTSVVVKERELYVYVKLYQYITVYKSFNPGEINHDQPLCI